MLFRTHSISEVGFFPETNYDAGEFYEKIHFHSHKHKPQRQKVRLGYPEMLSGNLEIFLIKYYIFIIFCFILLALSKVWAIYLHIRGDGVHYIKYLT